MNHAPIPIKRHPRIPCLTNELEHAVPNHTVDTIPLIFVMGATNVGKSTIMDTVRSYPTLGTIEVGKLMRAKYPPEHFQGQGAPAHTQVEAWKMLTDGIADHAGARIIIDRDEVRREVIFVDGQPRNQEQTKWALALPNPKLFLHLWAPPEVREARARNRDKDDPAKLELSLKRLIDDPRVLFDCLTMIKLNSERRSHMGAYENTYDTTAADFTPFQCVRHATNFICGKQGL